jgi:hypothetical protein
VRPRETPSQVDGHAIHAWAPEQSVHPTYRESVHPTYREKEQAMRELITQMMVPLDGSALTERALLSAARLAAATGATLHLARVVEPLPGAVSVYGPVTVPSRHLNLEAQAATPPDVETWVSPYSGRRSEGTTLQGMAAGFSE